MQTVQKKERIYQISGLMLIVLYGSFIFWLYIKNPAGITDLRAKMRLTVENIKTTAKVLTNTYEIDEEKFQEGLKAFRQDDFVLARRMFERADPAKQNAKVQFYVAYSFYRQGWGRLSSDDELFRRGLETINHVIELDRDFRSDDPDLKIKTPVELKQELEEGLQVKISDFNPLKLFRERK